MFGRIKRAYFHCTPPNRQIGYPKVPIRLALSLSFAVSLASCSSTVVPPHRVIAARVKAPTASTSAAPVQTRRQSVQRRGRVIRVHVPVRYIIRPGDTLWGIASRYLRSPWRWPDIWYLNRGIRNPDLIYPGDIILLGYHYGHRELTIMRGQAPVASTSRRYLEGLLRQRLESSIPTVNLQPQMIVRPLREPINVIPYADIAPFFDQPRAVSLEGYRHLPYVLRSVRRMTYAAPVERVYVRGLPAVGVHRKYALVRLIQPIRQWSSGKRLGYEVLEVGKVRLLHLGHPALFLLVHSTVEIRPGDRLMPLTEKGVYQNWVPSLPRSVVQGQIVAMATRFPDIGQYDIVVIDLGRRQGLRPGNVLDVFRPGENIEDQRALDDRSSDAHILPIKVGTALIFKTYSRFSYALILTEKWQVHVGAPVASPQIRPQNVKFIKVKRPWD